MTAAEDTRDDRAFIADAAPRHKIEERVGVYLVLGRDGWTVDQTCYGQGLFGYDNGALNEDCEHEPEHDDECDALIDAANRLPLPDGWDLFAMLAEGSGIAALTAHGATLLTALATAVANRRGVEMQDVLDRLGALNLDTLRVNDLFVAKAVNRFERVLYGSVTHRPLPTIPDYDPASHRRTP